jgi:pilus assembly protein Flp/PilA
MLNAIRRFVKEEDGASAAEYALLLALVCLGMIGAVGFLGTQIRDTINAAANLIVPPTTT